MVKVSEISLYHKCPRMCYFINKGNKLVKDASCEYVERIILKELALSYCLAYNSQEKFSILNDELKRIFGEIRFIYRTELKGVDDNILAGSVEGVRSCLYNISMNLLSNGDFYTYDSFQEEPVLQSEKSGLAGRPDKLIEINDSYIPSIIKTGNIPENGVWRSDRLQLTAYAMLVEEIYNTTVEHGFVEYARWGKVRKVLIKRYERRNVLQIRNKIKKIHQGFMPERPKNAPCIHCGFKEICEVKSTLASRFF
jgi:CRISPR-associated exonuclease Cas4